MRQIFLALVVSFCVTSSAGGQNLVFSYGNKASELQRQKGSTLHQQQEYDKAIVSYNKAIHLDPNNSFVYHQRGFSWLAKPDYEHAIRDFTKAIELEEVNGRGTLQQLSSYYGARGSAWILINEHNKAIADLNRAIELDSQSVLAYRFRAKAWYEKGDYVKANADFNQAAQLDPKKDGGYFSRGGYWRDIGEYDKAFADFAKALEIHPQQSVYHAAFAKLLAACPDARLRDGQKAVEEATLACELSSWKNYHSLESLAAAYAEAGQFDKAVQFQEKAIKASEANKKAKDNLNLCLALYREGKPYRLELAKK